MRIQIDTVQKTIRVEESVNLGRFIKMIKQMVPNWKKYVLQPGGIVDWVSPIYIEKYRPWWERPVYPWITYTTGDTNVYQGQDVMTFADQGVSGELTANVHNGTFCLQIEEALTVE